MSRAGDHAWSFDFYGFLMQNRIGRPGWSERVSGTALETYQSSLAFRRPGKPFEDRHVRTRVPRFSKRRAEDARPS